MGVSANLAQNALVLNNLAATPYTFRNRIINGNCNVIQRTAFAATAGTYGYGGPDRFYIQNQSSAGEVTQSLGTITYNGIVYNSVTQTVNTAIGEVTGTYYMSGIEQFIEGFNCYDLKGKPVTISFIFNTNVTGMYSVSLQDSGVNSCVATFNAVANVPQRVVINLPMLPLTLTIPDSVNAGMILWIGAITTGTYETSTLNEWTTGNYIVATGSTNWGMTAGNFIAATNIQLEEGTEATPFEILPVELAEEQCFRYYQVIYASGRFYATGANQYFNSNVNWQVMRTTPTATWNGVGGTNNLLSLALSVNTASSARFELISAAAGDTYAAPYGYNLSAELI
jgi:hypothetical protein